MTLRAGLAVLCGSIGGPATYGRRLAAALAALPDLELVVFTDCPDRFADLPGTTIPVPGGAGIDRLRWQHFALPRAVHKERVDLLHDTKNALPIRLRVPAVTTIHDLAYHRCPETFGFLSRQFLVRSTAHAARKAARIIVPSEATARDVRLVHPDVADKVRVVLHGIDPAPPVAEDRVRETLARLQVQEPYVLHVGTLQARKNVDLLVRAVRLLRRCGLPHRLVLAGRKAWKADAAIDEIARDETARWLGAVTDEDLPALRQGAAVFCSPSAYEGFGFTVAEAMAQGVPVVVSGISSLPELVGDAGVVLRDLEVETIADALGGLLADEAHRREVGAKGRERAAQFTWERAAAETLAVYREVVGGS